MIFLSRQPVRKNGSLFRPSHFFVVSRGTFWSDIKMTDEKNNMHYSCVTIVSVGGWDAILLSPRLPWAQTLCSADTGTEEKSCRGYYSMKQSTIKLYFYVNLFFFLNNYYATPTVGEWKWKSGMRGINRPLKKSIL